MSKVHSVFFQYDKANDTPFLGVTTRVYRVRLSDVGWLGERYIITQLVTDSSDRKPYVYRNELLDGVTGDCHAQRKAIRMHDDLVETVKREPQHAMCWIKQARKRDDAHVDDTEDAKANCPCEIVPTPKQVMHRDPSPKFAVGDWVWIVSHDGEREGDLGVITEVGDFGYYAVSAAPEQPCWAWWREECLEHAGAPAPIPDADDDDLTPTNDTF